jgi:hypothetical protein
MSTGDKSQLPLTACEEEVSLYAAVSSIGAPLVITSVCS